MSRYHAELQPQVEVEVFLSRNSTWHILTPSFEACCPFPFLAGCTSIMIFCQPCNLPRDKTMILCGTLHHKSCHDVHDWLKCWKRARFQALYRNEREFPWCAPHPQVYKQHSKNRGDLKRCLEGFILKFYTLKFEFGFAYQHWQRPWNSMVKWSKSTYAGRM